MRRFNKSESGAALVEFAIVAPVLALLLLGIVDFGRFMYTGLLAANAARAAAAYGAQTLSTAEDQGGMKAAANADSQGITWTTLNAVPVCIAGGVSITCGTNSSEIVYVQVNVSGTYNTLINYGLFPKQVSVSGSSTMRVEQQ
jgi:Flp pilus assembly protein TadG